MITLSSKQIRALTVFVSLLLGFILSFWPKPSFSQTVLSQQQAGSVLGIEKVAAQADGTVTGEIRNNSKNTVRDVQLFIRYTFLWKNEYHPGKESPSAAFYPTISGDIAPGGSLPFKFTPTPPLPKRTDGRFRNAVCFHRGVHSGYPAEQVRLRRTTGKLGPQRLWKALRAPERCLHLYRGRLGWSRHEPPPTLTRVHFSWRMPTSAGLPATSCRFSARTALKYRRERRDSCLGPGHSVNKKRSA